MADNLTRIMAVAQRNRPGPLAMTSPVSLSMDPAHVHNLVTFHLGQLGDLLFSLPALRALRRRFPQARIAAVLKPGLAELVRDSPWVDQTLWPETNTLPGFIRFGRALRQMKPDLAVCFSQSPRTMLSARLSGAPVRVGFAGGRFAGMLTDIALKQGPPSTTNNLRLVEALGCEVDQRTYEGLAPASEEAARRIAQRLAETGLPADTRWVVLGPAASAKRALKEWPRERFLDLARRLTQTPGRAAVFVGVQPFLQEEEKPGPRVFDWSGTTTLPELAALLRKAALFVGIDSGVMHLAAAMSVPVVALFGPSDPAVTGPENRRHEIVRADLDCLACHRKRCPTPECMTRITVDQALAACHRLKVLP